MWGNSVLSSNLMCSSNNDAKLNRSASETLNDVRNRAIFFRNSSCCFSAVVLNSSLPVGRLPFFESLWFKIPIKAIRLLSIPYEASQLLETGYYFQDECADANLLPTLLICCITKQNCCTHLRVTYNRLLLF